MRSGDEFEAILDDCIERLARGESLASCLQRYPAQADDLRDLLPTVQLLVALAVPPPPPASLMTTGKQQFERAVAVPLLPPVTVAAVPSLPPVTVAAPSVRPKSRFFLWEWLRNPQPVGRPAFLGLALLMIAALMTAATALSISALPGDLFYPPKVAAETIETGVRKILYPEQASVIQSEFDAKRAAEAQQVIDMGRTVPVTLSGLILYADANTLTLDSMARIALSPDLFRTYALYLRPGVRITVIGHTNPDDDIVQADQIVPPTPTVGNNQPAQSHPSATPTITRRAPVRPPTRRPNVVPVQPTRRPTTRPTRLPRPTATATTVQPTTPPVIGTSTPTPGPTSADLTPTITGTPGEFTPTTTATPADLTPTATPTSSEVTPTPTATEAVPPATSTPTVESPTDTPVPLPTDTPVPPPTDTPVPLPTDTPVPLPTDTPEATPGAGDHLQYPHWPVLWQWVAHNARLGLQRPMPARQQNEGLAACVAIPGPRQLTQP